MAVLEDRPPPLGERLAREGLGYLRYLRFTKKALAT
jgi:hypothetical protein